MEARQPDRGITFSLSSFSIDRLIRLAFHYGLLSDYQMTPRLVRLALKDGAVYEGDPEETRLYLVRLIQKHRRRQGGWGTGTIIGSWLESGGWDVVV